MVHGLLVFEGVGRGKVMLEGPRGWVTELSRVDIILICDSAAHQSGL